VISRRQARVARERARFRAALAHPAAAARYTYRRQERQAVTVGVWAVRRGCSVADVLGAFVVHVLAKFGFGFPPAPRPVRPSRAEVAALAAERAELAAVGVAALAADRTAAADRRPPVSRVWESIFVRGPGRPESVRIPCGDVYGFRPVPMRGHTV
jgi:hypothetical protein